ncbi:MAG: hypothetical protein ACJ8F7_04050 [Gemmataceae bacterium]
MRRRLPYLLVALLPLLPSAAQEKAAQPADANLFEVHFNDGSVVKMILLQESLDVTTRFGKLTVPMKDLRRIDFGLRYPDGVYLKIQDAIGLLNNPDFKKREAAQAELLGYRELAYPLVAQATRNTNAETARRARAILDELRGRVPEERLAAKAHDTIQTTDFPINGRIEVTTLKARSPLFGDATLKLTEIRSIRSLAAGGETNLTLDAASYGLVQESWCETDVEASGQVLNIVAEGRIDLYPFGGERGMYPATPDGSRPGGQPTVHPSGALLGKIGAAGRPFVVGTRFIGVPPGEGKLYLRIEASPWRVVPSGSYTVKITTG